jgi:hypothetical protein
MRIGKWAAKEWATKAGASAMVLAWQCVTPAWSAVLHCQVRYVSDTVQIDATPVSNPYGVATHDIGQNFRFKAVVVGADPRIDYIALYVYDLALPGAPVLVHEVVHKPPFQFNVPMPGLTGWNHIYSAKLGRELVYGCALEGAAP